jgi:hypothetical protein
VIPRQAPRLMTPTPAEPLSHSLSRTDAPYFVFPSTGGAWPARGSEDTSVTALSAQNGWRSCRSGLAKSFAISQMANFQGKAGERDGLQGTPCFQMHLNLVYSSSTCMNIIIFEPSTSNLSLPTLPSHLRYETFGPRPYY